MPEAYFITGTDTGIGKTWAAAALMEYFKAQGKTVIGMKPVASGCDVIGDKLYNSDALKLQQHASFEVPYEEINLYAYELPISPHLAGRDNPADFVRIKALFDKLAGRADVVVVEGAGGWYSPLNDNQHNGDLALALQIQVILVVGIRLGCINHAVLTAKAIAGDGCALAGWLGNGLGTDDAYDKQVIASLGNRVDAPCLGVLPFSPDVYMDSVLAAVRTAVHINKI